MRAYVITKTISIVEGVYAFETESDAYDKMVELVIENLREYGEACSTEEEAQEIVENEYHGSWDRNLIDFGGMDAPVYQIFDVAVLPYL